MRPRVPSRGSVVSFSGKRKIDTPAVGSVFFPCCGPDLYSLAVSDVVHSFTRVWDVVL